MLRVAFIRHTAVEQGAGRCYGRLDLPLAGTAEQEIAVLLESLRGFAGARLWTSPALRCLRLAEAIRPLVDGDVTSDDRLAELHFGDWEGMPWDQVPRDALDSWAADPVGFSAPGGESGAALVARATSFYESMTAVPGDHVVVSHGGPLRVLLALAGGRPVDLLAAPPPLGRVEIVEL